jgi:V8-like Glu-specific endopeptidase
MRFPTHFLGNSLETLESPFLDQEIVARASDRALDSAEQYDVGRAAGESERDADREADADRAYEHDEALAFQEEGFLDRDEVASEEEILGNEDRTHVTDTLRIPNRWICAIDVLTDNPDWGKYGQPQFLIKSRGTGTLIGPRYVLTAGHVVRGPAKGFLVSPARNGSNSTNPLGKIKSTAEHASPVRLVTRTVGQGAQARQVRFQQQDDYGLIVLERDLTTSTHSKMKGALNYWGFDQSIAVVRRLEPADINGKDIVVTGYPGDACGTSILTASTPADKKKKIDNCWNRRNDEWASTQWRCAGTAQVDPDLRRIFHTADTYEGQSGAPICLSFENKLNLIGIHTAPHDAQTNLGFRVTRRMLTELCDWINADAGYTAATVQNDTLVLQPPPAKAPAKGAKEVFEEEDAAELVGEDPSTPGESELSLDLTSEAFTEKKDEDEDKADEASHDFSFSRG